MEEINVSTHIRRQGVSKSNPRTQISKSTFAIHKLLIHYWFAACIKAHILISRYLISVLCDLNNPSYALLLWCWYKYKFSVQELTMIEKLPNYKISFKRCGIMPIEFDFLFCFQLIRQNRSLKLRTYSGCIWFLWLNPHSSHNSHRLRAQKRTDYNLLRITGVYKSFRKGRDNSENMRTQPHVDS